MRILVVEDESFTLFSLEAELIEAGYEVVLASCPEGAAARLEEESETLFALIVDLNLSAKETGFDVARRARSMRPDLPVIYVTGSARESWEREGVADSTFLEKPVVFERIAAELNRHRSARVS